MCYYKKQILKEMHVKNEMQLCQSESGSNMCGESGTRQHKRVSSKGLTLCVALSVQRLSKSKHYLFGKIKCNICYYSSTCHEGTPSGPGKSVRTLQVGTHRRDRWAAGGRQI